MQKEETINEFQKSQTVRFIDIVLVGPLLVYAGIRYFSILPKLISISLIIIGLATIVYNGNYYLKNLNQKPNA